MSTAPEWTRPGLVRQSVLLVISLSLFTNFSLYWAEILGGPIWPVHWMLAALAVSMPSLLNRGLHRSLLEPVPRWCSAYAVVLLVWFTAFGASNMAMLEQRLFPVILLLAIYIALRAWPGLWNAVSIAASVTVLASAPLFVYDLTHPFVLVPAWAGSSVPGRASGLFLNANAAGMGVLLCMIVGASSADRRVRLLLIVLAFAAVLATLSRSAIVGWFVAVLLMWRVSRSIGGRDIVLAGLTVVACAAAFSIMFLSSLEELGIKPSVVMERVDWIVSGGSASDFSSWQRAEIARKAWRLIELHPLSGSGLGATELWTQGLGTHNAYLSSMADFGLLGILILPLLAWCMSKPKPSSCLFDARVIALMILYFAFFDHAILSQPLVMLIAGSAAARARTPAKEASDRMDAGKSWLGECV